MNLKRLSFAKLLSNVEGASLVELALSMPMFLVILAGAVDFGHAYCVSIEVAGAAQAGALYGVRFPTDVSGMQEAAQNGAPDLTSFNSVAAYGCECPDGTSAVPNCTAPPSCSANYVNYVQVTTSAIYSPIITLPGLPAANSLQGFSRMRVGGD